MRRLKLLLLLAAACAAAGPLAAQEPSPTLTLDDAIRLALQRNKVLKVTSYLRGISRADLLAARGQFDPALVLNRSFSQSQFTSTLGPIPVADNTKTDNYSVALQGVLPLGTQYTLTGSTLEVRDNYNGISRNYQTFGGFQVVQPLLKGFGLGANLVNVRVAKANRTISDLAYRQSAIDTVTEVILAYSNLQLAHDQLDAARRARSVAVSFMEDNEKSFKIGSVSQSDVITSRADAAQYEESILLAERAVRDSQNQLRKLIGEDTFLEDEPLFTLAPMVVPDVTVDRRADLERALNTRPDYRQQRLLIAKNRALESAAVNGVLPEVDFVGGYGYNGSSYSFTASRQMVQDHQNPSVSAGVTVTVPLTFAVGRGRMRAARLQRAQSEEDLRRLEADIAVSVSNAAGQIETSRKRVAADEVAYSLAKQALEAEEKKKKAGTSSTLYVLQQQHSVVNTEINVSYALASERQAVANYDHELGTTLERHQITLADE